MIDIFQRVLLYVALGGLAVALTLLAVRSKTLRVVQARLLALWGALTPCGRVISVSLLAISILYGGGKQGGEKCLNVRVSECLNVRMLECLNEGRVVSYAEKKARAWNIRGAWKDSFWLKFADGWRFPYGTNHLRGVEVISYGELWQTPFDNNAVASIGAPAEIVPTLSSFSYEFTPSNSYRFAWENVAIGRGTNNLLTASLELFRNGDILTVTNGVAVYKERELPFHHDGFGQDDEWVRANFTNSTEILSVGYLNWVDEQVGVGLENGLYKLTVVVPEIPPETTQLKVGDYSVAVTNEGEYVFLLEKGVKYPLSVFPEDFTNLTYSAVDDISGSRTRSGETRGQSNFVWTIGVGAFLYEPSSLGALGWCMWVPNLRGSPDVDHLGPGDFPKVFTAVITDCRYAMEALYEWSSSSVDVDIVTPHNKSTLIRVKTMPSWREANLNVVATLCGTQLISTLSGFSYGTNNIPQINLSLSIPRAILLNSNKVDAAKLARGGLSFSSDIETNGVLKLSCISGGERVFLWDNTNKHNSVSLPYVCDVEEFDNLEFFVEGIVESDGISDVKLKAEFIPSAGRKLETEAESTVIKIGDLILPGAPSDGLLIMRGTSVAAKVECKPQEASALLSTMWQTRRLKTDGSYPPLANEWYDSSYDIKGWEVITLSDFPQVGFVSAKRGEINGHMGIVDFDGNVISAGMDNVNRFLSLKNTIMRKFKEK